NTFSDVDSTLTYSATLGNDAALPAWLTFTAATRTFSGTPPANFSGALDLKVTASDGAAAIADTFTLNVAPVADAPTLAANSTPIAAANEFRVNATTLNDQTLPSVTGLAGGGYVVTWEASSQDGSGKGIYAQRYDASGATVGGEFLVNTFTSSDQ